MDYTAITNDDFHLEVNLQANTSKIVQDSDLAIMDNDTVYNIENVIGTAGNDTFSGSSENNEFDGNDGTQDV